jgi:hypothetical protein
LITEPNYKTLDFSRIDSDVKGQESIAMEIAAWRTYILIVRLAENDVAKRLPSILPPMTLREVRNY